MNKLFTKIAALALGATMAVGVGVAVASTSKDASRVDATDVNTSFTTGSNTVAIKVNYNSAGAPSSNNGVRLGTSNNAGSATFSIPSGTTKFGFYAVGWKGKATTASVSASVGTISTATASLTSNANATGTINANATVSITETVANTKKEFSISNVTSASTITLTTSGTNKRLIAWDAYYVSADITLSSISISTHPTKTTYLVGEYFDPTGLVITRTYSDSSSDTYSYAGHESDFTFSPTTSTALTTSDTSVTITYGGKNCSQSITVNAPKTPDSLSTSSQTATFESGDAFVYDGTLTVTYTDSTSAAVSPESFKIGASDINPITEGTVITPGTTTLNSNDHNGKTVYVLYTENNTTVYTSYVITVNPISSVTFTAGTDVGTSSSQTADTISKKGISMYCSSIHDTGNAYRYYKDSTLTFTSTIGNMARIEFTGNDTSNKISNLGSETTGTLSTDSTANTATWTGNAATVSFTASAQSRASLVVITLKSNEKTVTLDQSEVDLYTTDTVGVVVTATVENVDNPTYSWVANNNNVTLEDDDTATVTIKPNTNVAASSTVTLTVGGTTPNLTATVSVSISVPGPGETPETAYSVAEAIESIDEKGEQANVYVAGIISQIDAYYSNYHSITYWISDDGTTTSQFEVYSGKGLNGADFTSIDDLVIGSEVIVFGTIKLYSSTYEFAQSSSIYSLVIPPQVNSITLTPSIVEVAPEATGDITDLFTSIVINQDQGSTKTVNDIVWSTGDENVFYVDGGEYLVAGGHKDSTTLYASIGGKVYGSATIEVVDPDHPFIVYDIPVEWTVVSDPSTLIAGDKVILTGVKNEVTYAATTYTSGKNVPADTENTLTVSGSNVTGVVSTMIYTLETGSETGTLAFKDSAGKYLYAAGGTNSNYMKTESTINANASFVLNSDGTVVAQGASTHNYMRYNNSSTSNLFSCYGSTSTTGDLVTFYKMSGGEAMTLDLDDTILTLVRSKMSNYQDEHGETQYGLSICNYNGGSDLSGWSTTVANGFTDSIISTYKLAYARSNRAGNDVEKFLSAYDYVVENYGASYDFLGRIASGKIVPSGGRVNPINTIISGESTTAITIVVIVSLVSLTAIGGYFFIKRRKEN